MSIKKYANLNTLSIFLDNLKNLFVTKTEHSQYADEVNTKLETVDQL